MKSGFYDKVKTSIKFEQLEQEIKSGLQSLKRLNWSTDAVNTAG